MSLQNPRELNQLVHQEQEARFRLEEARERNLRDEGVDPGEHHELIRKLEEEWKRATERLHLARHHKEG